MKKLLLAFTFLSSVVVGSSAQTVGPLDSHTLGQPNGPARLDSSGRLPATNLPLSVGVLGGNSITAAGAADAITASLSNITTLTAGTILFVKAAAANATRTPTLTITLSNAATIGPLTITKSGGQALLPRDIFAAGVVLQLNYTGTGFELLNPTFSSGMSVINADNLGIGTSDDTALWSLIDAQIGADSSLPRDVFVSRTTSVKNLNLTNIQRLHGIRGQSTFTLAASGTTSSWVVRYVGTGPFEIDDLAISCPVYNPVTRAQPLGNFGFLVQPTSTSTQVSHVSAKHLQFTGCQNQLEIYQTEDVDMEDIYNDRAWGWGWIVSDGNDGATVHTRHIRIRDTHGINPGQYCGSLPVNLTASSLSPRHIDIDGVSCEGAGFIGQKFCYDLTGTSFDQVRFRGSGRNCFAGGMEIKRTGDVVGNVPNGIYSVDVEFDYRSNYDRGTGVWWAYEVGSPTSGPDQHATLKGNLFVTYKTPDAWQASTYYDAGSVVQNGSNTYLASTSGTTASSGGPSGTTTGIADGTATWDYLQATPASPAAIQAGQVEAVTDADLSYTFYNVSQGVALATRGSSDTTIRRINLTLKGTAWKSCLNDNSAFTGTIDRLTVDGACLSGGNNGFPVFDLGVGGGITYTDFNLKGGPWVEKTGLLAGSLAPSGTGVIRLNPNNTLTGFISGGVHMSADNGIIYNQATMNLTIGGGGIWEIGNSAGGQAVRGVGASATGTIEVGQVRLTSATSVASSAYDSWANTGGAATLVYGRFIRGYKSAAPTDHCNSGDVYLSQAPGVGGQPANGWFCSTPGTTWTSY